MSRPTRRDAATGLCQTGGDRSRGLMAATFQCLWNYGIIMMGLLWDYDGIIMGL